MNRTGPTQAKDSYLRNETLFVQKIFAGAQLEDITGVPSRSTLMRGKFEASYVDDIEEMVATMVKEIEATVEDN